MALKNYTTKVPADRSVQEIQKMLSLHGATGVLTEYEKGTGRIASLCFQISLDKYAAPNNKARVIGFRLPLRWEEARKVMISQKIRRADVDEDYCYRVAWRILRDWVDVQMALVEMEMAQLEEIFLPYTVQRNNKTLYENVVMDPSKLLGDGQ